MPAGGSVGRKPAGGRQGKGPPPSCLLALPDSITGNGSLPWRGSKLHLQSSILCFSTRAPRTSPQNQPPEPSESPALSGRRLLLGGLSPNSVSGALLSSFWVPAAPHSAPAGDGCVALTLPGGSCSRFCVSPPHCLKNAGKTDVCSFCCLS